MTDEYEYDAEDTQAARDTEKGKPLESIGGFEDWDEDAYRQEPLHNFPAPPAEDRYPAVSYPKPLPPGVRNPLLEEKLRERQQPQTQPKPKRQFNARGCLANLVTTALLLSTVGIGVYTWYVFNNPFTALNPLAPPTPLPIIITETPLPPTATIRPTATETPVVVAIASSSTPTQAGVNIGFPEPTADETSSDLPTSVADALAGAIEIPLQSTDAPPGDSTADRTIAFPFEVAEPGVIYTPNGNGRGCEWLSIAGIVTGLDGAPINGLGVRITDVEIDGASTVFCGSNLTFGDGGYELFLDPAPKQALYTVQLVGGDDVMLSEAVQVVTSDQCNQNVAVVNFVQVAAN